MKTTLEIPDELLEEAKAAAAQSGISLRAFVSEALRDKLAEAAKCEKPWMASFGKLSSLRSETARINRVIEEEFGQVSS
jgi:metal-responsive CopG/Arc/MetJ family transcriptional regulator